MTTKTHTVENNNFNIENYRDDISPQTANSAYSALYHSSEKWGAQFIASYLGMLKTAFDIVEDFEKFREELKQKALDFLAATGRTQSPGVSGPANFPTRRNDKRKATASKRYSEMMEYFNKSTKPQKARPIMVTDPDAIERLEKKILIEKDIHVESKKINSILRKFKSRGRDQIKKDLQAFGMDEKTIDLHLFQNIGNQKYILCSVASCNAEIKRLEGQLSRAKQHKEESKEYLNSENLRFEDCPDENAVRIFFPDKPSLEIRKRMRDKTREKKYRFRWDRDLKAWQADHNEQNILFAQNLVNGSKAEEV